MTNMNSVFLIFAVILSLVLFSALLVFFYTKIASLLTSENQAFQSKQNLELSQLIIKNSAEIRHELAEKLNEKFSLLQKDLKEDQRLAREEQREVLFKNTNILENKFVDLEKRVSERLEQIGKEVQVKLDKNLQDGFSHFQKIQETLIGAEKNLSIVGSSIQDLNNVLNLPHLRGKLIGEGTLERLLADFLPSGYYELQYSIESNLVDAVVKFPHLNLVLPIDSKFSLEQVAPLFDKSANPEQLKIARKKLAEIVK